MTWPWPYKWVKVISSVLQLPWNADIRSDTWFFFQLVLEALSSSDNWQKIIQYFYDKQKQKALNNVHIKTLANWNGCGGIPVVYSALMKMIYGVWQAFILIRPANITMKLTSMNPHPFHYDHVIWRHWTICCPAVGQPCRMHFPITAPISPNDQ